MLVKRTMFLTMQAPAIGGLFNILIFIGLVFVTAFQILLEQLHVDRTKDRKYGSLGRQ